MHEFSVEGYAPPTARGEERSEGGATGVFGWHHLRVQKHGTWFLQRLSQRSTRRPLGSETGYAKKCLLSLFFVVVVAVVFVCDFKVCMSTSRTYTSPQCLHGKQPQVTETNLARVCHGLKSSPASA